MRERPPRTRKGLFDPAVRRRGMQVVPNLFTTGALFAGFLAIVQGMDKNFERASLAIFAAMILDSLDGRVARFTNTQSEFGAEFDSLSDMVSFGVAPALVVYEWTLRGFDRWGWMVAFFYCAMAALRLARFNTNIGVVDKRYFQGLPSPAAAAIVASFVWLCSDKQIPVGTRGDHTPADWVALVLTACAGATMFVNVPFYSGKDFNPRRWIPVTVGVTVILGTVLFLLAASVDVPVAVFSLALAYGLSGYIAWAWRRLRTGNESKRQQDLF
jgi:CDP-diacylglycerol---serine O-phosphatidyltransferase